MKPPFSERFMDACIKASEPMAYILCSITAAYLIYAVYVTVWGK